MFIISKIVGSIRKTVISAMSIAFALIVVASTGHTEGIQSDVVGYSHSDLRKNFSALGAQFAPIAAEKTDLMDIVPTGYDKASYEGGSIYVQMLDARGRQVAGSDFYWYDNNYDGIDYKGWFNGANEPLEKGAVKLAVGEAIWISANSPDEKIQTAGQVVNGSINVTLRAGFKLVCNPTPVKVFFNPQTAGGKHIVVGGYDKATYEGGSIYSQKLTANGRQVPGSDYYWYDNNYDGVDYYGWFNGANEFVTDGAVEGGEAIWVSAGNDQQFINFPAAL